MDYFESGVSYDSLTHRLNEVHSELSMKYNKIAMIWTGIWLLGAGIGTYFVLMSNSKIELVLVPILGGGLATMITYLISKGVMNSKIRNQYLNKEVMNLYNMTEGTMVQYELKPEFNKKYNQEMALYIRYATASCKYKMYVEDPGQYNYEILRTSLITSNGKSSQVHFDGDYLILNLPTSQHFHIKHRKQRTNRKGFKFYKIEDPEHHIYLSEDDYDKEEKRVIRPLNRQFLSLYSFAKEVFGTDKISIGSNKTQLHVAISEKVKYRVPKEFNYDNVKTYYDDFTKVITGANQLIQYISEQELI